jgi:hypothetical protein
VVGYRTNRPQALLEFSTNRGFGRSPLLLDMPHSFPFVFDSTGDLLRSFPVVLAL